MSVLLWIKTEHFDMEQCVRELQTSINNPVLAYPVEYLTKHFMCF